MLRRRQPQGSVIIDWQNTITNGLAFIYVLLPGNAEGWSIDGTNVKPYLTSGGAPTAEIISTPIGVGARGITSGYIISTASTFTPLKTSNYSFFAVANRNVFNVNQSVFDDDNGTTRRMQHRVNTSNKVEFIPFTSAGVNITLPAFPNALTQSESIGGFTTGVTASPTLVTAFQNRDKVSATVASPYVGALNGDIWVGSRKTGGTQTWSNGGISLAIAWNRTLSDAEMLSLANNPWQLFLSQNDDYIKTLLKAYPSNVVYRRALIIDNGIIKEIVDALLGTSRKPLVLLNGSIQERVGSEGLPIVLVNGVFKTLSATETLLI